MKPKYPNQRYTNNDEKLSKYILNLSTNGQELPYITDISKETGISTATISRWAKRRGYYSFGDLRASFNKNDETDNKKVMQISELFQSSSNFAIIHSEFTIPVAQLIVNKLNDINVGARLIGDSEKIRKNETVIAITLSGYSKKIAKFLSNNNKQSVNLLTTNGDALKKQHVNVYIINKMKYSDQGLFEGYKVLRELYELIDDAINIVYIRKSKK